MRLAAALLALLALVCSARADDAYRYRQIRFGNVLSGGHLSACSVQFQIAFDPRAPSRREDTVEGVIVFMRPDGRFLVAVSMRAFGDYTTKLTGVGQVSDISLTSDGRVLWPETHVVRAAPAQPAPSSDRVAGLLAAIEEGATLSFTLSDPVRHFSFPLSLDEEGLSATSGDLARAGRSIFDGCMAALASASH